MPGELQELAAFSDALTVSACRNKQWVSAQAALPVAYDRYTVKEIGKLACLIRSPVATAHQRAHFVNVLKGYFLYSTTTNIQRSGITRCMLELIRTVI